MESYGDNLKIIFDDKNKAPFFYDEFCSDFNGSLPDIIAVQSEIKPATRLTINSMEMAAKFLILCKKNNFYWHIPKNNQNLKYAFISKSQKVINNLKKIDSKFFYDDNIKTAPRKIISQYLGYPLCCIDAHIRDDKHFIDIFDGNIKKISFLFNNFLNPVSNLYLSFHSPCSFVCAKTKNYNNKILSAISKANPVFAIFLKKYLKKPTLVFGSLTSYNDFWNSRFVILFDGFFSDKDQITYSDVFKVIPFDDNFLMNIFEKKFNSLYELIRRGNRIKIGEDHFFVYKNNKLVGRCDRYKKYASAIFDFK